MFEVTNKTIFYKYYNRGLFGNRLRSWNSYKKLMEDPYNGNVTIRSLKTAYASQYEVPKQNVLSKIIGPVEHYKFNESAPEHDMIVQGELMTLPGGLYFYYSFEKLPMKVALSVCPKHDTGLIVNEILRYTCTPSSYEDILELLDTYKNHVIELSVFNKNVGILPHRNTIIWEVRLY